MAKKANYSLSLFEVGEIAADGGMGTNLVSFGDPVRDTAVFTQADGTTTDFNTEIEEDPYFSVVTPGKKTITLDLYATDAQQLQNLFGGTYTPAVTGASPAPASWENTSEVIQVEKSVQMTHKNGSILQFPRVSMTVRPEWNFRHNGLPLLHLSFDVLKPTKDGVGSWKFIEAPAS